jgi:hypothetical protein
MGIVRNKATFKIGYDTDEHAWVLVAEYIKDGKEECFCTGVDALDFRKGMDELTETYMRIHSLVHPTDMGK